ncbi:MAG: hypothetical protein QG635_562, partial [Bacteroidota bacterium]|nr:hypothetical protein [Bacteroidota bacterium]
VLDEISNMRIDFILSYTMYEKEAIERAKIVKIDDIDISFCSLEDMIILKLFAGRQIDIEDVRIIIRKNPNFNRQLVIDNLRELSKAIDIDLVSRLLSLDK